MQDQGGRRKGERYAVIHGHFYQPPRENPWIEDVEHQESAAPFHDWNEFITNQCYLPNMVARIVKDGKITELVNNYAYINFNIGPTLMNYLRKHFPEVYDGVREADRISTRANNGHGNAIAQSYSHSILPLENERDKHTQVIWGVKDFIHHFGREPEAMWLPETACNFQTLAVLIEHGMKYVVLAQTQAEKTRPLDGGTWRDVSNSTIDPRKPYRHFLTDEKGRRIDERHIDVFFYDGPLSRDIAFTGVTTHAELCTDRLERAYGRREYSPMLVSIATDGETFGHHHHFSEMCLAYLTKYELLRRKINIVNYSNYLEICPPKDEVLIKQGADGEGTSWSCAHGVGRWKEDCGCATGHGGFHQRWRGPLRHAYRQLRDILAEVFDEEGGKLFHDPWEARNDYVSIILDRSEANVSRWLNEHLKKRLTPDTRTAALRLLEMQRHAMLMFTSCGWFFDELSRIETVQTMLYASRAAQLAEQVTGRHFEPQLKKNLELAEGNIAEHPNGKIIYEKFVEPSRVDWSKAVAQYAIRKALIPEEPAPNKFYDFIVEDRGSRWETANSWLLGAGHTRFFDGITYESHEAQFFCIHFGSEFVKCFVSDYPGEQKFREMQSYVLANADKLIEVGLNTIVKRHFDGRLYVLDDLFREDREKVITRIMKERIELLKVDFARIFRENVSLMERYRKLGWPIPDEFKIPSQFVVAEELADRLEDSQKDFNLDRVREMKHTIELCRRLGFDLALNQAGTMLQQMILDRLDSLANHLRIDDAQKLNELLRLGKELQIDYGSYRPQNLMSRLLNTVVRGAVDRGGNTGDTGKAVALILKAARMMDFDIDHWWEVAGRRAEEALKLMV